MLPRNHEISFLSGEIILKKDEDFDTSNFDGYLSTRVQLWPISSPSTPPSTPDLYPDSDDNGYDCK